MRSHSRIRALLLAFSLVLLVAGAQSIDTGTAGMGRDDALALVVANALDGSTDGLWVFAAPGPAAPGEVIATWYGDVALPASGGWLFFIDDAPMESWAHPCRYVVVDAAGGVSVQEALGPPSALETWAKVAGSVVPAAPAGPGRFTSQIASSMLPPCQESGHCYAVIISGGANAWNNWPRYYSDVQFMYKTLVNDYGYLDDHIIVLMSDGTNPADDIHTQTDPDPDHDPVIPELYGNSDPDLDGDGDDDVGFSASRANIATVFSDLQARLGDGDHLFIFTTDHGGPENDPQVGTNVVMNLWGETIRDDQFDTELAKISTDVPIMVTMEQCYSGGFVDDVIPSVPLSSGQERVIATAANAYESSYGDAFSKAWIAGVAGHTVGGSSVDADADNDGTVSLREAFDYAVANDPYAASGDEHPQYSETPASIGSTLALSSCYAPILPIANAGADIVTEQTALAGTAATLDGTGSADPCGKPLTWAWTWPGGAATGPTPTATFPLGTTVVTLIVTADGRTSEPDTVLVTVQDTTPPALTVPPDITVEQATRDGTSVPLTATATDICDAAVEVTSDALAIYPLGTTTVTFTAKDDSGNSATGSMTVHVVDTTPPVVGFTLTPNVLWPPNHKMVTIRAAVTATDICDAAPAVRLLSITSDEPDDAPGLGDGATVQDIQAAIGTGTRTFKLRAERAGELDGRVYTVTYTATDASGNTGTATTTVRVPHDM